MAACDGVKRSNVMLSGLKLEQERWLRGVVPVRLIFRPACVEEQGQAQEVVC